MKKNFLVLLSVAVLFGSCKKDEENSDPGNSTVKVSDVSTDMSQELRGFMENDGISQLRNMNTYFNVTQIQDNNSLRTITEKNNLRERYKAVAEGMVSGVEEVVSSSQESINARTAGGETIDLGVEKGVYAWDYTQEDFKVVSTGGNTLELQFPASKSDSISQNNNASLIISKYTESTDGLSGLEMAIDVDDSEVLSLSYSATFKGGLPSLLNLEMRSTPFSMTMNFADLSNSTSIAMAFKESNEPIMSTALKITFASTAKEEPKLLEGEWQLLSLSLVANLDVDRINAVTEDENATFEDLNNSLDIRFVETDTRKYIGRVEFSDQGDGGLIVKYNDNTTASLEDVFAPIERELEDFIAMFEDPNTI